MKHPSSTQRTPGNDHGDRAKARTPAELRNTTAPRKAADQPDDPQAHGRRSTTDYDGAARKDH